MLVTGGAGFIGSHLCRRLIDEGCDVIAFDNLLTGRVENIEPLLGHERFEFQHYDVTNFLYVEGELDAILHFASPASPADFERLPIQILKVGSLGTHKALGLAKAKGARFLLASTSECYGDPEVNPQPESYWGNVNPIGIRGVYDEAKRFAEAMTMAYHRHHGVDVRIVRIFNTFGPRMQLDDGRAIPNFFSPGASRRGRHALRRRLPDPFLLLRGRPGRGHLAPAVLETTWAREHRQPARDVAARHGGEDHRITGSRAASSRSRCRPTTRRCAARHHARPGGARRLGAAVPVRKASSERATTSRGAPRGLRRA